MYKGHFPPLSQAAMLRSPPFSFVDDEGREIDVRAYGDGPVQDEYEAIVAMYLDYDPDYRTLGIPPAGESRIRQWQDKILVGHCVLAWHGERVVGQAVLVADGAAESETAPETCELAIFLHQDYHGAGIGTHLTEGLLTYGREHGVEEVWLLVERENRPAVNLYNDVGFVVADRHGYDVEMVLTL